MAEPATVEVLPVAVTVAPSDVATFRGSDRLNLHQLFVMYDLGLTLLPRSERERWRSSLAMAASHGGAWAAEVGGKIVSLAAFWPTKNPHINPAKGMPAFDAEGNYVYICWMMNFSNTQLARTVIAHVRRVVPWVEFIAWHDTRSRRGRRRKGDQLWVLQVRDAEIVRLLASRNGKEH